MKIHSIEITEDNIENIKNKIIYNYNYIKYLIDPSYELITLSIKGAVERFGDVIKIFNYINKDHIRFKDIFLYTIKLASSYIASELIKKYNIIKSNDDYDVAIEVLKIHPYVYREFYKNIKQTDEIINLALVHEFNIKYIENPSEEICKKLIKKLPTIIGVIKQTEELKWLAIKSQEAINNASMYSIWSDNSILGSIKNPSYEMQMYCVKTFDGSLRFIKNQTSELIELSLNKNPNTIDFIIKQKKEYCIKALNNSVHSISYIRLKYQTLSVIKYFKEVLKNDKQTYSIPTRITQYRYLKYIYGIDNIKALDIFIKNYKVLNKQVKNKILLNLFSKQDKISFELGLNILNGRNL